MDASRRNFCKGAAAAALGGAALCAPVAAGLAALLSPLRERGGTADFVRVAPLEAVPADDAPRKFTVYADLVDAWNKFPNQPIGAIYLRRDAKGQVQALNATCPHAGGFIDFMPSEQCFLCPLHKSRFKADGAIADPKSPAPRPMDTLAVEVRDGAIWVQFENFRPGTAEKLPA